MRANLVDLVGFCLLMGVPLLLGYIWGWGRCDRERQEEIDALHAVAEEELRRHGWEPQPWDRSP